MMQGSTAVHFLRAVSAGESAPTPTSRAALTRAGGANTVSPSQPAVDRLKAIAALAAQPVEHLSQTATACTRLGTTVHRCAGLPNI